MSRFSITVEGSNEKIEEKNRLLQGLYASRNFADFHIEVEGELLKCHKLVLASTSEYFRSILMSNGAELVGVTEMVEEGCSVAAVRSVLDYMYDNRTLIRDVEHALEVLDVATRWKIDDVFLKQVEDAVTTGLTTGNCLKVRDYFLKEDRQHVVALVDRYIEQHFVEVTNTDVFQKANLHYVLHLFDSEDLQIEDEKQVYEAGLRWLNYDMKSREQHMCTVMKTVRMGLMESEDLSIIGLDLGHKYSKELDDFIRENMDYLKNKKYRRETNAKIKSARRRRQGQVIKKTLMCLGGYDGVDTLTSVLTSDDDGRTWSAADDMSTDRIFFSATVCSGFVFVVGGLTSVGDITKSCEKYEIRSKRWTRIVDLPEERCGHSAASGEGCQQLYVTGGEERWCGNATDTVLKLDVGAARVEWTTAPPMMTPRDDHVSCFLNGALYVVGGWDDYCNSLKSCEMLDLESNKWRSVAPTNYEHYVAGACTDGVQRWYVAGDCGRGREQCQVEVYDVTTNQWSVLGASPTAVKWALTLVHHDNKVYVVGGEGAAGRRYDDVQVLDTTADRWSVVAHLPAPRSRHATVSF